MFSTLLVLFLLLLWLLPCVILMMQSPIKVLLVHCITLLLLVRIYHLLLAKCHNLCMLPLMFNLLLSKRFFGILEVHCLLGFCLKEALCHYWPFFYSNWAGNQLDRQSITVFVVFVRCNPISWVF